MRYARAELPTPGLYTTIRRDGMKENFHTGVRKVGFHNFQVEKREGTPYRTHSYLLGGAA